MLYIDAGGTNSQIKLTAHLSDGSAADYVATASGTGVFTNLYTLVYQAASENTMLTITLQNTGNAGSNDGSVDLVAAALRGPTVVKVASLGFDYDGLGVISDPAGNIYLAGDSTGITNAPGVVYKLSPPAYTQETIGLSGTGLSGPLVLDKGGNLYGWEDEGSDEGNVTNGIFEIPVGTSTLKTIVPASALGNPTYGGLLALDASGNLLVEDGGIFEVAAGTHSVRELTNFAPKNAPNDGVFDSSGDFLGASVSYSSSGDTTTIFEVPADSSTITTLATLPEAQGASLLLGDGGVIYGSSSASGNFGHGTIFEITPGNEQFHVLFNDTSTTDALELGNDGNLFVINYDSGQIDELFPVSGQRVQISKAPLSYFGWLIDNAGNIYFTGSQDNDATTSIYQVDAATGKASIAVTSPAALGGVYGLYFADSAGNLFGSSGGLFNGGLYEASDAGFVPVQSVPVINYQPTNETGVSGSRVFFNASVDSTPAASVQWQISTDGGGTFTDITGNPTATTQSLALDNLSLNQSGEQFRAVFSNSLGKSTSNAATLSVLPPLQLVSPARADAATVTGVFTGLSASAIDPTGQSQLTYTWSVLKEPDGAGVKFSANGTAAAADVTARFTAAGSYTFKCTISDGGVRTITTQTSVSVVQSPTQLLISRGPFTLSATHTAFINAHVYDQFDDAMQPPPAIQYSVARGLGTINSATGEFTASIYPGYVQVRAASGSLSDLLGISVDS